MPERELDKLLRTISPKLQAGQYVFCSLRAGKDKRFNLQPLCMFREEEGVSVVLEKSVADEKGLNYSSCWSWITCKVNSDLQAVGFLAAITRKLAASGIPVNPISAFFHDHLLVPIDRTDEALGLIRELSQSSYIEEGPKTEQVSDAQYAAENR
jgi:uncharacterized protein